MFRCSDYGDTAVACNIKTLDMLITTNRYPKMWKNNNEINFSAT